MRKDTICSKVILAMFVLGLGLANKSNAQSANFNFTAAAAAVSGWTNAAGDPSVAVRSFTAPSGITLSSVATANWYPEPTGNSCAFNGGGVNEAGFFPAAVLINHWFVYGTTSASTLNLSTPQLVIGGLHNDSTYTLRLSGSFAGDLPSPFSLDPIMYTIIGATNYGSMGINGDFNTTDGAIFNGVIPDSTGNIRVYLNTANGSNIASLCGLQISTGAATAASLTLGAGLAQLGQSIALGDSVTGLGPHSFASNRYQYLNGSFYSFGGSVNDPVAHPVLRLYNNGDLAASTTMDKSVNTANQTGLRYYAKPGYVQIGASDRLDTTQSPIVFGSYPSSGIIINSDVTNTFKGKLMNSVFAADVSTVDSGVYMQNNYVATESVHFAGSNTAFIRSFIGGYGHTLSASVNGSLIDGQGLAISKPVNYGVITGYVNTSADTMSESIIGGVHNQFGGVAQLVSGQGLVNRSPAGTTLGNYNVDFSTLSYTGTRGTNVTGIAGYPLFVLGNSASNTGAVHSNALTVLYNGRTQINTTGHTNTLTQANVTPQAALDVVSTNTGVLLPRLTTAQRNAILSVDLHNGLLLYNTDSSAFQYYNGTGWNSIGVGGTASTRWLYTNGALYDSLDNVGIGTSNTKGYKLAVNGSAIFTRVVVKPYASWPDYVFSKEYVLPELHELEQFVFANHHLPGVASAREVRDHGIDVAEQQAALLKQIEDITLYLLKENRDLGRQHKELSEVNAQLEAQQKEIDGIKAILVSKAKQNQKKTK